MLAIMLYTVCAVYNGDGEGPRGLSNDSSRGVSGGAIALYIAILNLLQRLIEQHTFTHSFQVL